MSLYWDGAQVPSPGMLLTMSNGELLFFFVKNFGLIDEKHKRSIILFHADIK